MKKHDCIDISGIDNAVGMSKPISSEKVFNLNTLNYLTHSVSYLNC